MSAPQDAGGARACTAAVELQAEGLTVRLSFSLERPEFSTLSAERPICEPTLSEALYRAEPLVVDAAMAAAPALLQAFEKAQSVLQQSLALREDAVYKALKANHDQHVAQAGFVDLKLIYGIAGCLAFIAIGASFNIDNSYVNALHWLLAGLGLLCIMGIMLSWACDIWEQVSDALDYRTANGFGIESQTRKLQADASRGVTPAHQRPPFKPTLPRHTAAVTSLDKAYRATLAQARLSGEAAGLLHAKGGPAGVNPHRPGTRAHITWLTSYEAVLEAKGAADAQHARNQRTAA